MLLHNVPLESKQVKWQFEKNKHIRGNDGTASKCEATQHSANITKKVRNKVLYLSNYRLGLNATW